MLSFILCYLAAPIIVGIIVQLFSYWLNKKDSKKQCSFNLSWVSPTNKKNTGLPSCVFLFNAFSFILCFATLIITTKTYAVNKRQPNLSEIDYYFSLVYLFYFNNKQFNSLVALVAPLVLSRIYSVDILPPVISAPLRRVTSSQKLIFGLSQFWDS